MADGKRYYWLRLKDDFFDSLRIKRLRKLAGGDTYTIIYLKMQLKAIKSGGVLEFKGYEQDFADELALDLDETPENVRVTLQYLLSCGLCECSDNVNFFLPYAVDNTGSEDASAKRVREYRERQKALQCNADVTEVKRICNVEKEIEKEKDTRDREIDSQARPTRHKYGPFSNVLLSDDELAKLKEKFPNDYEMRINDLSIYIDSKGDKYKRHYSTILNWDRMDKMDQKRKSDRQQKPQENASFETDEFLGLALSRS